VRRGSASDRRRERGGGDPDSLRVVVLRWPDGATEETENPPGGRQASGSGLVGCGDDIGVAEHHALGRGFDLPPLHLPGFPKPARREQGLLVTTGGPCAFMAEIAGCASGRAAPGPPIAGRGRLRFCPRTPEIPLKLSESRDGARSRPVTEHAENAGATRIVQTDCWGENVEDRGNRTPVPQRRDR
jgi:hypothetical protein